ncbi:hypothetical protein [Salinarimonas soli]|uniref:Glycine zipper domain-containing protein n=1 Tax=Salinarimonas soli TaxID=1638099 RepID=A0A5B2V7I5_9HYPH|nr:hypothetical protein [Salinarimonas soli]KAA2234974.1 hypothetical protein F0L46_21780 [Salinarimonas soli]
MRQLALLALPCLALAACASPQQSAGTAVGATAGAVVGGPVGAVVGGAVGAAATSPGVAGPSGGTVVVDQRATSGRPIVRKD